VILHARDPSLRGGDNTNLKHWSEMPSGGHFASLKVPTLHIAKAVAMADDIPVVMQSCDSARERERTPMQRA
jgi:hypothetical protein